jgi:hypothetical protein
MLCFFKEIWLKKGVLPKIQLAIFHIFLQQAPEQVFWFPRLPLDTRI